MLEKKVQISNKIMDNNDHKSYLKQSDSRVKCMNVSVFDLDDVLTPRQH